MMMIAMLLVKATFVIALAAAVQALAGRRASAATRHWVWTLAVAALLLLPLASRTVPIWNVAVPIAVPADRGSLSDVPTPGAGAVLQSDTPNPAATSAPATRSEAPARSLDLFPRWPAALVAFYVAGALLFAVRLAMQQLAARRLMAGAEEVRQPEWKTVLRTCAAEIGVTRPVQLRRASAELMPMACGIRRPAILVPAVADEWTAERRRAVLLHELAHIARHDCLTQLLAQAACALYWVHPGVWWAARRLRVERELACDDRVLAAGTEARDYAGHLLEIAFSLGQHRAPAAAVSMARPGQLEGRMLAVLDSARNRAIPGLRGRLAGAALAAIVSVPLAALAASIVPVAADADLVSSRRSFVNADVAVPFSRPADDAGRAASGGVGQETRSEARGAGTWEISPADKAGHVHLQMRENRSSSGTTVPLSRLEGLTEAQMAGGGGPVRFSLRRDAGTFTFEGMFRSGVGGGTYTFSASPTFGQDLQKRGIGSPSAAEQYEMARHDVGLALVDELAAQGYQRPTIADLIKAGHHGVGPDFVRGMAQLGYKLGTVEPLVQLRDHGVGPDYVRDMAAEGLKGLSADELVKMRDHGVTPDYVQQLRQLGYSNLPIEALVNARDHGVTPEFVKALGQAGYTALPLDQVIKARDHGVTPEFVKALGELGHTGLSLEQVITARDHGVTPEFARGLHALGHKASLAELVTARDHGVTPEYASALKTLGYGNLSLSELVRLRDHGVTPERVKRANERAGTTLPIDMLVSLANGGWR